MQYVMRYATVMNMNDVITITSKGQTTLPVALRKRLGINSDGGVLRIRFNERRGEIIISKPVTIAEVSERVSRNIKSDTVPVRNVDEYYQNNRGDQ